jgi:hypothetical protein
MNDALERFLSQTYITIVLDSLEPRHEVVTLDDKLQARQRLIGKFKVLQRPLMARRLLAFRDKAPLNPIEVEALAGELRIHFLPPEVFSQAENAGHVQLWEPGEPPLPKGYWLSVELLLPDRFYDSVLGTKVISCTVEGLQKPTTEFGPHHWEDAPRKSLPVRDAQYAESLPPS